MVWPTFLRRPRAADSGLTRTGRTLFPFPELSAGVPLAVHLILEDRGHTVQPRPSGGRTLIVHGTPIAHRARLPYRAHTLPYPRGQIPLLAHYDALALPIQGPVRPDNRAVPACLRFLHTQQLPRSLERGFHFRAPARIR